MRRVTRSGGTIASAIHDFRGGLAPFLMFWDIASALDSRAQAIRDTILSHPLVWPEGQANMWRAVGLADVVEVPLVIPFDYTSFADYGSTFSVAWRMAVDRSVSSYERQKDWSAVHLIARFRSHEARIRSIETDPPNERLGSNRCISNLSEYLLKPRSSRASCHSVGEPTPIRQRCRVSFRGANPQPPHARGLPGATLT